MEFDFQNLLWSNESFATLRINSVAISKYVFDELSVYTICSVSKAAEV